MKRLFMVIEKNDRHRSPIGESAYYENKAKAKEIRNAANFRQEPKGEFIIAPGPDHRNYRG